MTRAKLIDVVSGQAVAIESLAASVVDGQRFSVTEANFRRFGGQAAK
jgi:hypothetical protein